MKKPLIIGLRNPSTRLPALSPERKGSSGYRLWEMWNPSRSRDGFIEAFDRANLVDDRDAIGDLIRDRSDVLVLGGEVWAGLRLDPSTPLLGCQRRGSVCMHRVPHPSGRNLWYNDPDNCRAVGELMRRLTDVRKQ